MKMAAYGIPKYFSDPFSRFDAVVVFASLLELLLDYTHINIGINPSFLRAFRLMRAFKLARSWKGLASLASNPNPNAFSPNPSPTPKPIPKPNPYP